MKTQPYGKLTQHACLTTPLRNLTLFRFLLTPKFHMTRPLLSSSWEVSCGAQLFEGTSSLQVVLEKPPLHGSHRPGMGLCACFCVSAPAVATSVKDQEHSCSPYVPKVFPCMQVCITQMISSAPQRQPRGRWVPSRPRIWDSITCHLDGDIVWQASTSVHPTQHVSKRIPFE